MLLARWSGIDGRAQLSRSSLALNQVIAICAAEGTAMMDWNGNMSTGDGSSRVWDADHPCARGRGDRLDRKRARRSQTAGLSAPELLDRRLASGEINAEQYERLRQSLVLRPDSGSAPPPTRPANVPG